MLAPLVQQLALVEVQAVTDHAFVILWASGQKPLVRVSPFSSSCLSERLDFVLRGGVKGGQLIDMQGNLLTIQEAKVIGVDWSAAKIGGAITGMIGTLIGGLTLSVLVKVRIQTEPIKSLSVSEAADFLTTAMMKNPSAYSHAPAEEISRRLHRSRSMQQMVSQFYRD